MADRFFIKKGDLSPSLPATLTQGDGSVMDLTGATVAFRMAPVGGNTLKVNAAAVVVSASAGTVRYDWAGADTDTVGEFEGEFVVTIAGKSATVPSKGFLIVEVGRRADD